jgi:ATP-dependent Clp protease ATP-binding subunit ClpC
MISVDRFTKSAQDVAQRAAEIMQRYRYNQIDTEHMLLALIEQPQGVVYQLLQIIKVDANALSAGLDSILRTGAKGEPAEVGPGVVSITPDVVRIIDLAIEETNRLKDELISDEHLFLAFFREPNTSATQLLEGAGLTRDRVYDAIQQMRG